MKTFQLSIDLQFDSRETAVVFAQVLAKTMQITARTTIDVSSAPDARVVLGKTTLAETEDEFKPNKA